jgi:nucleotide-binding universal stress UspA family protein
MTIACGTDFSEHGGAAVTAAAAFARRLGERLILVHALDERFMDEVAGRARALRKSLRDRLETAAVALRSQGIEVETVLLTGGAPDETIVDWITRGAPQLVGGRTEHEPPQLMLLGALGYRDESRWRLGSIAERITQRAPVPVVVVRDAHPFEAWARDERALRVFVGLDFSRSSLRTLEWVGALCSAGPCDVVVGHTYWPWDAYRRLGMRGPMDLAVGNVEVERALIQELTARVGTLPGRGRCDVRVQQGVGVLAPTDFSPLSNRAIPYAYGLAGAGGTVYLLHVIEPNTLLSPLRSHDTPGLAPTLEEQAAERANLARRLAGLAPAEAVLHGIETETVIVAADDRVADAIRETADRLDVDAICLSSHGRSGLSKALAGSVAQRVLTRNDRPCFVIRPPRTDD